VTEETKTTEPLRNRVKKNRHLLHGGKRYSIDLTPAAIALLGKWSNSAVADTFVRFSVACGGPSGFVEALAHWSDSSRIGSVGLAIEVSIWWNAGKESIND